MKLCTFCCLLILSTLYISVHSEDLIAYATHTANSTFEVALGLPSGNTNTVCVQGRIGNSTLGPPIFEYCSKTTVVGWQPVPCTYSVDFDLPWTLIALNAPEDTSLNITSVPHNTPVTYLLHDTEFFTTTEVIEDEWRTLCCDSSATYKFTILSDNITSSASIDTKFYLDIGVGEATDVQFIVQRSPCGPALAKAPYDIDYVKFKKLVVDITPLQYASYGWNDWYIVITPNYPNVTVTFKLEYTLQASKPCGGTYKDNKVCGGHGQCIEGVCKCENCFRYSTTCVLEDCSYHGVCNIDTDVCTCSPGYTGDKCEFDGTTQEVHAEILSGGGAALLAIGMFILGSVAGIATLLVVNKKIRRAVYSEVSIQDRDFEKVVS